MASSPGHIELERAVESITVGAHHRTDLGDLDGLIESIRREGLLQPITITLDGVLVCGARRLAALRALGIRTVNVWIRAGITDRLGQLLAEQDDNQLHKPLTPTEQATLDRELKIVTTEDATRRQEATLVHGRRPPPQDRWWCHRGTTVRNDREDQSASGPDGHRPEPRSRGGNLGVRTDNRTPPDVSGLAKAFIGVIIARRYADRDTANTQMASYPSRHTPTPRRPGTGPVEWAPYTPNCVSPTHQFMPTGIAPAILGRVFLSLRKPRGTRSY